MSAMERRLVMVAALALLGPAAGWTAEDEPAQDPQQTQVPPQPEKKKEEDGSFEPKLTGYARADGRFYLSDGANAGLDTFVVRRVRPIVLGTAAWRPTPTTARTSKRGSSSGRSRRDVANYHHTSFEGGGAAGADRKAENAFFLRAQVSF